MADCIRCTKCGGSIGRPGISPYEHFTAPVDYTTQWPPQIYLDMQAAGHPLPYCDKHNFDVDSGTKRASNHVNKFRSDYGKHTKNARVDN